MQNRRYSKNILLHPSVVMKQVCNDEEWITINSDAQIIAQNKPGQREINSKALKKVWQSNKAEGWRESIIKT